MMELSKAIIYADSSFNAHASKMKKATNIPKHMIPKEMFESAFSQLP